MHSSYKAERVGSSPTARTNKRSRSLTVRIPGFHLGGRGSIPLGSTTKMRGNMYRIEDFKVGDRLYRFINSKWEYVTSIVVKSHTSYGIRNKHVNGIIMIERNIMEKEGYIALPSKKKA
jgi:hypothetical protein